MVIATSMHPFPVLPTEFLLTEPPLHVSGDLKTTEASCGHRGSPRVGKGLLGPTYILVRIPPKLRAACTCMKLALHKGDGVLL